MKYKKMFFALPHFFGRNSKTEEGGVPMTFGGKLLLSKVQKRRQ